MISPDDDHDNHIVPNNSNDNDDNDGIVDVAIEMTETTNSPPRPPVVVVVSTSSSSAPPMVGNSSSYTTTTVMREGNDILTTMDKNNHNSLNNNNNNNNRDMKITTANEVPTLPTVVKEKTRTYLHRFFYPHQHKQQEYISTTTTTTTTTTATTTASSTKKPSSTTVPGPTRRDHDYDSQHPNQKAQLPPHSSNIADPLQQQHHPSSPVFRNDNNNNNTHNNNRNSHHHNTIETKHTPNNNNSAIPDMNDPDIKFVTNFWTTYDDILILSIFTQLGIVFRLAIAIWFKYFDDVFSNDSALFVNLPLNCLSCFLMGLLCSGERLMETISTRFSPTDTQQTIVSLSSSSTLLPPQVRPYSDYVIDDDDEVDEGDLYNNDDRYNSTGSLQSRNNGSNDGLVIRTNELRQRRHNNNNSHQFQLEKQSRFNNLLRRRRTKRDKRQYSEPRFVSWQPPVSLDAELRDVQLLALERRIRMSKCLVLFPVRKQDVDVMEHYFQQGYKRRQGDNDSGDAMSHDEFVSDSSSNGDIHGRKSNVNNNNSTTIPNHGVLQPRRLDERLARSADKQSTRLTQTNGTVGDTTTADVVDNDTTTNNNNVTIVSPDGTETNTDTPPSGDDGTQQNADYITEITDLANNIQDNVQENLYRLQRVNLADGWDTGTTANAMSDDLMLGLRDGFCGALSSFSSWNSAMVSLLRKGQFTQAFVGYMIGLQLPIVAYRFGQHVAVYIFIWRTRRETHKDERRGGYGIRLANHDDDDDDDDDDIEQRKGSNGNDGEEDDSDDDDEEKKRKAAENEMPSLRAVITAIFIMAIVTQCTSIFFYNTPKDQQIALSLLFSPLGVFARWRLTKLNRWKPTFPLGTFTCNILACALSGSLGETDQVVLVSIVNGFGGTLSSLASFVVEILAGIDPILFRFDGVIYAAASIGCAMVVGFIFSASVEWADAVVARTATVIPDDIDIVISNITDDVVMNVTSNLSRYW